MDSELGGAYYAVTKPPAFNFNREFQAVMTSTACELSQGHLPRRCRLLA